MTDHVTHMRAAIEQARIAGAAGNIAVGSIIVRDDTVIGAGHNMVEVDGDPTAHAEVMAIRDACRREGVVKLRDVPSCEWPSSSWRASNGSSTGGPGSVARGRAGP